MHRGHTPRYFDIHPHFLEELHFCTTGHDDCLTVHLLEFMHVIIELVTVIHHSPALHLLKFVVRG